MRTTTLARFIGLASLAACAREPGGARVPVDDPRGPRAMAAMTQFRETLAMMLTTTMKAQGPVAAIEVCSASAPQLAVQASQAGLVIGRATDRPRNQANAATGWRVDALAALAASPRPARFERVLDDGRLAIALPLEIQAPCLTCHGTAIQPEVASTLAARYPADKATGYALGELRGVLWAEVE